MTSRTLLMLGAALTLGVRAGWAACGCDKPAPPPAAIRPFATVPGQTVTLWDHGLKSRVIYTVQFKSRDGTIRTSVGKSVPRRDFYQAAIHDTTLHPTLRVTVPDMPLGPCEVSVFDRNNVLVTTLTDDQLTITSPPIALHDFAERIERPNYQAGVGTDGTVYLAIDTSQVNTATTYTGYGIGYPLQFDGSGVAVFNSQGFEMVFLGMSKPVGDPAGWFQIATGDTATSAALSYWRHEFITYKQTHLSDPNHITDDEGNWHIDGTYHVDNFQMLVAIAGTLPDGQAPAPGATPPFTLVLTSTPAEAPPSN